MTVREFAESRGVSKQLIYQKVKEAGKQITDLTEKGQITESGLEFLEGIIPDKKSQESEKTGSESPVKEKKETELDRLTKQNETLLETISNMSDTIKGLREDLSKAQKIADQAQQLHAIDKQRIMDLTKRLEAGSAPEEPIQPDQPEGESQEKKSDPVTVQTEEPEKKDPDQNKDDHKPDEPDKREGETPSPVTGDQSRTEQKKPSFGKRLRFLFTGKE